MADFSALKTAIQNAIKQNGNEEITGTLLQQILLSMVTSLGDNAINSLLTAFNTAVTNLTNAIGDESTARQSADSTIIHDLNVESQSRAYGDSQLENAIQAEANARQQADNSLSNSISAEANARAAAVSNEAGSRAEGDNALQVQINGINLNLTNVIEELRQLIQISVQGEANARQVADNTLAQSINAEAQTRANAILNEAAIRLNEDNKLQLQINGIALDFDNVVEEVRNILRDYSPIIINGDVSNAPDENDLTTTPNNLLKFKDNIYNPLVFSGMGKKFLRKNLRPLSPSYGFDGIVENISTQEELSGIPTQIFWDRERECFVGLLDGVYYLSWTNDDAYVPVSTENIYMYDSNPYKWNGTDFYVDDQELPNIRNVLTQDMINEANTIYVIRYDYTIVQDITILDGCVLDFQGGSISGSHTITLQNTLFDGDIKIGSDVTFSGTCKNQTAYQSWFVDNDVDAWHKFINNVSGVVNYGYTHGEYNCNVYISKSVTSFINIVGNGAKLIFPVTDGINAIKLFPTNDNNVPSANLTAVAFKGNTQISVSDASKFKAGDIISIIDQTDYSYSPHRPAYRQCEFAEILSINGTNIVLSNPLYGNYVHSGSCKIFLLNHYACKISDLTFDISGNIADISFTALHVEKAVNCVLRGIKVNNYRDNIRVANSQHVLVENCDSVVTTTQQAGIDSYALSISSCQDVNIIGGRYVGGNHGISFGGGYNNFAAICRQCVVDNVRCKAIKDGFIYGFDTHGDVEYITLENSVLDGAYIRGKNINVLYNFFENVGITSSELISANFNFVGNIFRSGGISFTIQDTDNDNWFKEGGEETLNVIGNKSYESFTKTESGGVITTAHQLYWALIANISDQYYNAANTKIIFENNSFKDGYVTSVAPLSDIIIRNNILECNNDAVNSLSTVYITGSKVVIRNNQFNNLIKEYILKAPYIEVNSNSLALQENQNAFRINSTIDRIEIKENDILEGYILRFAKYKVSNLIIRGNKFRGVGYALLGENDAASKADIVSVVDNEFNSYNSVRILYINRLFTKGNNLYNKYVTPQLDNVDSLVSGDNNSGITTDLNSISFALGGKVFFDNTLSKALFSSLKNKSQLATISTNRSQGITYIANTIPQGTVCRLDEQRLDKNWLAFSKVGSDATDGDLMIVSRNTKESYFVAPDPTVYPYLCAYSNNTSWTNFFVYSVDIWKEADGAKAGVLRSGTFTNKPDAADIYVGFQYFNTDTKKNITWDGSKWYNPDGTETLA